jgi:hypothetical protein
MTEDDLAGKALRDVGYFDGLRPTRYISESSSRV